MLFSCKWWIYVRRNAFVGRPPDATEVTHCPQHGSSHGTRPKGFILFTFELILLGKEEFGSSSSTRITLLPRFIYCANIEFTFGWSSSWEGNWMLFALLPLTQRSRRPLNRRRRLHEHVVGLAFFQLLALAAFFLFRRWVSCFILGNRGT